MEDINLGINIEGKAHNIYTVKKSPKQGTHKRTQQKCNFCLHSGLFVSRMHCYHMCTLPLSFGKDFCDVETS